jgi:hypothetical protein
MEVQRSTTVPAARFYKQLPLHFRAWVPVPHDDKECWRWTGKHHRKTGAALAMDGPYRGLPAVYWSWALHFGKLKAGYRVMPRCRNKSCVNPNHLMAVPRR